MLAKCWGYKNESSVAPTHKGITGWRGEGKADISKYL
jgi:hypothetical protein